jgi:hypothetical protein
MKGFLATKKPGLLLVHFRDTLIVIVLDALLAAVIDLADKIIGLPADLVQMINRVAEWFCIAAVILFAVESIFLLGITGFKEIREASKKEAKRE